MLLNSTPYCLYIVIAIIALENLKCAWWSVSKCHQILYLSCVSQVLWTQSLYITLILPSFSPIWPDIVRELVVVAVSQVAITVSSYHLTFQWCSGVKYTEHSLVIHSLLVNCVLHKTSSSLEIITEYWVGIRQEHSGTCSLLYN